MFRRIIPALAAVLCLMACKRTPLQEAYRELDIAIAHRKSIRMHLNARMILSVQNFGRPVVTVSDGSMNGNCSPGTSIIALIPLHYMYHG